MKKTPLILLAAASVIVVFAQADSVLGLDDDGVVEVISDVSGADVAAQPEEFVRIGEQTWCRAAHFEIHGR
jgi:hypothetical protein